jgi:hypothetical protein
MCKRFTLTENNTRNSVELYPRQLSKATHCLSGSAIVLIPIYLGFSWGPRIFRYGWPEDLRGVLAVLIFWAFLLSIQFIGLFSLYRGMARYVITTDSILCFQRKKCLWTLPLKQVDSLICVRSGVRIVRRRGRTRNMYLFHYRRSEIESVANLIQSRLMVMG